jgi:hypothetical protein
MYLYTSELIGITILIASMLTVGGLMFKRNMELERSNANLRRQVRALRNWSKN